MLQQLLADYFKLSLHQESRDLPAYELVAAEGGVILTKAAAGVTFEITVTFQRAGSDG